MAADGKRLIERVNMREPLSVGVGASPPVTDLKVEPSSEPLPVRFAEAVKLFLRGGAWTTQDHASWLALVGTPLCTKTNLLLMADRVIGEAGVAGNAVGRRGQGGEAGLEAACHDGAGAASPGEEGAERSGPAVVARRGADR
jgi:hypothetical protein